jgi:hypothetical protein
LVVSVALAIVQAVVVTPQRQLQAGVAVVAAGPRQVVLEQAVLAALVAMQLQAQLLKHIRITEMFTEVRRNDANTYRFACRSL